MQNRHRSRVIVLPILGVLLSSVVWAGDLTVSPSQYDFGSVPAFVTGQSQDFTLHNGTGVLVNVSSVTSSASDFVVTSFCSVIPANFSCVFQIAPRPQTTGLVSASVTVKSNASNGDVVIPVMATGLGGVSISPDSLSYTNISPNTSSSAQKITIGNGTANSISPVITLGDQVNFSISSTCGSSLPSGQTCSISATFTPKQAGIFQSTVTITESSQGINKSIPLTGAAGMPISLNPSQVTFPDQQVNTSSIPVPVQVTNNSAGNASVLISTSAQSGNFFVSLGTCFGVSLAFGQSCNLNAYFAPKTGGPLQDSATINFGPQIIMSGNGILSGDVLQASASPTFAATPLGQFTTGSITLTNVGSVSVNITSITVTGTLPNGVFTSTNDCPVPLSPGSHCSASIKFIPDEAKQFTGTLNVYFDNAGSPIKVGLVATGVATGPFSFTKIVLPFDMQLVGSTSPVQQAVLANSSGGAVSVSGITVSGDFKQSNNCPATMNNGATCSISVSFHPTTTGNRTGTVVVNSSAGTQTMNVSGSGQTLNLIFQRPPRTKRPN